MLAPASECGKLYSGRGFDHGSCILKGIGHIRYPYDVIEHHKKLDLSREGVWCLPSSL
ncbi:hypothetical protein L211DRAFT_841604 [Terfezia boudieri ATCC MYA-4762]|uniref:Uncharacterized protein n=1 Tax=Terfezia boudieri ATCC MYA-4762 TaxID=1051890 RepID=A0A3N4LCB1_9PEZI|nr:hypothetical protein L211DRAFT_841604 [Terfezia boudieri ATCC MYA-4762]